MNPTAFPAAPGLRPAARIPATGATCLAALLALLLGGAGLASCSGGPATRGGDAATLRALATLAEAAATAYVMRDDADPKRRAEIAAGTAVLNAALAAWTAAPADDATARAMEAALAAVTAALHEAGILLAGQ